MATIYEVSDLAGVSLATVSRVINGNAPVSSKTRDKVKAAIAALDYRPSNAAKSLASNRSDSIGILVSEFHGSFYGAMMTGIEDNLRKGGKHAIMAAGHSDEASEREGIEFLINRSCDALILHVEAVSDDYLIKLSKGGTPFVLINRFIPALAHLCISLNNHLGGAIVAQKLVELGHKRIAFISGPLWKGDSSDRLTGFKDGLRKLGCIFDDTLFYEGDYHEGSGQTAFDALWHRDPTFTAVFCANDEMAAGALTAARKAGLKLPNEMSVIGYDNTIFADYLYPPLTTVNYPVGKMGRMAAQLILRNIYHAAIKNINHEFEPALVLRDSITRPNT